jgi:hypothetical protein
VSGWCQKGVVLLSALLAALKFYLQISDFFEWAMLGSNQRPPPCKGGPKGS